MNYHGSGYIKEELLRLLVNKRAFFDKEFKQAAQEMLLHTVVQRHGKEFGYYCKFAVHVSDESFIQKLKALKDEQLVGSKAEQQIIWMLELIQPDKK